ncbi:MAG TPA: porin [Byssovorax sp.]|jgi:phosphate-selective porin
MRSPVAVAVIAAGLASAHVVFAQAVAPGPAPAQPPPPPPPPGAPAQVEVVVAAPPPFSPAPSAYAGPPLAGYHGGAFYLRDEHDNFRLYLQGRAQIDAYTYFGPGVSDSTLKPTMLLRRVRPELSGEVLGQWQWMLAGDFGTTSVDNSKGTTETTTSSPGSAPTATSGKYASAQTPSIKAAPTDVFMNWHPRIPVPINVQFGQFDAPFTQENRTSDKYIPFMERSLAVRDLGEPNNKEIGFMAWGETSKRHVAYALGAFLGDGQNRLNVDSRLDFMGRVFAHPLATTDSPVKNLQIGASLHVGDRDPRSVNYDAPSFTTQGNFAFWSPTYGGTKGTTHVIPEGQQNGVAGELRVPVSIFDLTSELVYVSNGTREAIEGYQATNTERFGAMRAYAYYVELGVWPFGNRDVNGQPGYENPTHVELDKPDDDPAQALQVLLKWEQLHARYQSAVRGGDADPKGIDGDIKVNVIELGANYWATKHVRLTVNYAFDMFPGSEPSSQTTPTSPPQTISQRAVAPGNTLSTGVNDSARDSAHALHELLFRVAVAF